MHYIMRVDTSLPRFWTLTNQKTWPLQLYRWTKPNYQTKLEKHLHYIMRVDTGGSCSFVWCVIVSAARASALEFNKLSQPARARE